MRFQKSDYWFFRSAFSTPSVSNLFSGSATGTDVPICEGQHIVRRQCHCPNHETIRSRVKIRQMDRQLEIKNLKSYDAGKYFCIKETGQQDDIKTTDIMGQINLHIVELKKIDIVLDYDVRLFILHCQLTMISARFK